MFVNEKYEKRIKCKLCEYGDSKEKLLVKHMGNKYMTVHTPLKPGTYI